MRTIRRIGRKENGPRLVKARAAGGSLPALDARLAAIQALIPLGLAAVEAELDAEVTRLAGPRYARQDGRPHPVRWGHQAGSVYLADQKLSIAVPRVRDRQRAATAPLHHVGRSRSPSPVVPGPWLGGRGRARVSRRRWRSTGPWCSRSFPPEMAAEVSLSRFRREIQLPASLQYPHIMPLLTAGEIPAGPAEGPALGAGPSCGPARQVPL